MGIRGQGESVDAILCHVTATQLSDQLHDVLGCPPIEHGGERVLPPKWVCVNYGYCNRVCHRW